MNLCNCHLFLGGVMFTIAATFLVDTLTGLLAGAAVFTLGLDIAADAGGGISFFAADAMVRPPPLVDRVDRTIVWNVVNPVDSLNVTTAGMMNR